MLAGNGAPGILPGSWDALSKLEVRRRHCQWELSVLRVTALDMRSQFLCRRPQHLRTANLPESFEACACAWTACEPLREVTPSLCSIPNVCCKCAVAASCSRLVLNRPLQVLDVRRNCLNGYLPDYSRLDALQTLDVSENDFTGPAPMPWYGLKALKFLRFARNAISGEIPYQWRQLYALVELDVRGNCGVCGRKPSFSWPVVSGVACLLTMRMRDCYV